MLIMMLNPVSQQLQEAEICDGFGLKIVLEVEFSDVVVC